MKFKSLFLGICLAASALAAGVPAYARSSTAYDSFKIQYSFTPESAGYNCLREDYGAVRNDCGVTVYLMFDMPIDNVGVHTVTVSNYWNGTGPDGVSCTPWTYDGYGNGVPGYQQTFTAHGSGTLTWNTSFVQHSNSITMFCSVPPGQGLANLNWTL